MKKKVAKLTESENQVMDLLWDQEDDYLTSSEIVENCENRIWKPSYIHILINSLLKKEMIEVAGFKKTTKNYARTFRPTMTSFVSHNSKKPLPAPCPSFSPHYWRMRRMHRYLTAFPICLINVKKNWTIETLLI